MAGVLIFPSNQVQKFQFLYSAFHWNLIPTPRSATMSLHSQAERNSLISPSMNFLAGGSMLCESWSHRTRELRFYERKHMVRFW